MSCARSASWRSRLYSLSGTTTAVSSLLPLGESLALGIVYAGRLDYGRIRSWGSVGFILGALGAGAFVTVETSEIVLILLIGGFIIMSTGVAGLYIGKVFDQVKDRPLYVIDQAIVDGRRQ